jgi:hypothetical protein
LSEQMVSLNNDRKDNRSQCQEDHRSA